MDLTSLQAINGSDSIGFNFNNLESPIAYNHYRDECSLRPCGPEAGCLNTNQGHQCICTHDLRPEDPILGCDRGKQAKTVIDTDHVDHSSLPALPISPINRNHETIDGHTKQTEPFWKSDQESANLTHSKQLSNNKVFNSLLFPTIFCLLSFALLIGMFMVLRRYNVISKLRSRRKLSPDPSKGSLARCIQQYVINPNYYSSSPDASFRKILRNIEIPSNQIRYLEEIGEGCFGRVYKGEYQPTEDQVIQVAIKILKEGVSNELRNDFEREVEILSNFRHPNIVKLIGVTNEEVTPSMVFEYMALGDLTEILRKCDPRKLKHKNVDSPCSSTTGTILSTTDESEIKPLYEGDLIWIATQIAAGMLYLSSQHFVHRDLATRNCLVTHNLTVKISDFGLSRDIYTCDYYKVNGTKMLPIRWMSPESIIYGKYTLESDVWSFGVVLWEIFAFGKQPYYGHSNDEVIRLILQGILLIPPEDCPEFIYKLMAGCWKTEPKDRLNFNTIYKELITNCSPDRQRIMDEIEKQESEEESETADEIVNIENYLMPEDLVEIV
ncbi:tyrosine-protein kinase transmembrane receptor Ror-like [Tetranychus urticae]|uniref:Protein kinase domain-containing protein n=1 Tax=Tetranychus urticae TaxID=32264 RepID=T1KK75_TETUR|nr:tyrosine-protein kinase transmembrane receptor Ror-like [Tetranychus urticae]